MTYHVHPSSRSSFGKKSNSETSMGSPNSTVIFGKRKNLPFTFTFSALRTVAGTSGALPMRAMNAPPEWSSGFWLPLPRRVPSG